MKESNRLFELVKAMSASEKGYFKKYTLIHGKVQEKIYIKLFNIISSQEKYDEKKLIDELRKNSASQKFGSYQNYLYKLILKSLRSYHSDGSSLAITTGLLLDSVILRDKGLIEESNKMVDSAKELAENSEDLFSLLKAYELQQRNNYQKLDIRKVELHEKQINSSILELMDKEKEIVEVDRIVDKVLILYLRYGTSTTDKVAISKCLKILEDPLLKAGKKFNTRKALYKIFNAKNFLYNILGDYKAMIQNSELHLLTLEKDPLFNKDAMIKKSYMIILSNIMNATTELRILEEFINISNKLRSMKLDTPEQERMLFSHAYSNILAGFITFGMPDKGLELIPEINKKMKKYEGKLSEEHVLIFHVNMADIYFMVGDYSNSLKLINKSLKDLDKHIRPDTQISLKILNILIHYEMHNYQLVDSLIISLKRFLPKTDSLDLFSKTVIKYIKKLLFLRDKKEIQEGFLSFKNELEVVAKNEKNKYPHILFWIDKKLEVSSKK